MTHILHRQLRGTLPLAVGGHVLVAPPFVSTPEDIDEIAGRLAAVGAALATLPATERATA